MEWIIVHGLFKIDRIQYLDPISAIYQHLSTLYNDRSLWICDHIRYMICHLHQIGFDVKSGFTWSWAPDHDHILVSGILGSLWPAVHRKPFCFGQNDVIFKYRIYKRFNILPVSPSGRSILFSMPELLRILRFIIQDQPKDKRGHQSS